MQSTWLVTQRRHTEPPGNLLSSLRSASPREQQQAAIDKPIGRSQKRALLQRPFSGLGKTHTQPIGRS